MKVKNILKKFGHVALAALVLAVGLVGQAKATAPDIKKEITGGGYFGGGTFTYTLTPGTVPPGSYPGYRERTSTSGDLISIGGPIDISAGDTTGSVGINVNQAAVDAADPGVYRYTIKENTSNIAGMTDDTREFDIDVFVTTTNGTDRTISHYIVSQGGTKGDLKFTNTLAQEDLIITKTLTGNQANNADKFDFNISVTSSANNNAIRYSYGATSDRVIPGTPVTLSDVGHGDTITITGLVVGDQVVITESDTQSRGYTATVTSGGNQIANGDVNSGVTANVTVAQNQANIDWVNENNAQVPTGIRSNVLPFALVVTSVLMFALVYFRRNKEDQEDL